MFEDVKAVLFALDGTLIDSAPDLGAAADKMRSVRGLPSLPFEKYRPMAGAGARGMLGVAFGITPDHADFAAMREEFFRNYESCMTQRTYVFDGVQQLGPLVGQVLHHEAGGQEREQRVDVNVLERGRDPKPQREQDEDQLAAD